MVKFGEKYYYGNIFFCERNIEEILLRKGIPLW